MSTAVTDKRIQDMFKRVVDNLERKDVAERRMLGIRGGVGELEELLGSMME